MKISIVVGALCAFAANGFVQAETPVVRRVEAASKNVAAGSCNISNNWCNPRTAPHPCMLNGATPQEERAAEAPTVVEKAKHDDDDCNRWNNWCNGKAPASPMVAGGAAPDGRSVDAKKRAAEAPTNVATMGRFRDDCGPNIACNENGPLCVYKQRSSLLRRFTRNP